MSLNGGGVKPFVNKAFALKSGTILTSTLIFSQSNVSYQPLYDEASFNTRNIDLTRPVGTIEGTAEVSQSGAATYLIPIQIDQYECPIV